MSSLDTGGTDTYLDVLRTLGVTDAELRRHHGVAADEPLRAAIAADLESPTDDLVAALAATGRVLAPDAEAGLEDGELLAAALGRFGYGLDVATSDSGPSDGETAGADDGDAPADAPADRSSDALELVVYDTVLDDATRVRTDATWAAVRESLAAAVLEPAGVALVPLLDGRTLLADARRLERLRVAYGPRIEPFDTPLLSPEADVDEESLPDGPGVVAGDWAGGAAAAERAGPRVERDGPPADGAAGAPDDVVEAPGHDRSGSATGGPDDTVPGLAADAADLGGGPRRMVSTSGIDEVFDQLESDAAEAADDSASAPATTTSGSTTTTSGPTTTTSSDPDLLDDWDDAAVETGSSTGGLAGAGPQRTVSETSADDILDRASGRTDFETVAAEQATGDAVPDDAAEVSELAAAVADVQSDPDTDEPSVAQLVEAAAESTADDAEGVTDDAEASRRDGDVLESLRSTLGQ